MKKILVTGADGFVGQALCAHLSRAGYAMLPVVRNARRQGELGIGDLGSYTQWSTLLGNVDAVVHLAARAHITRDSSSDPLSEFRRVNVVPTLRIATAAAAAGVSRFVFMSSIGVNGTYTTGQAFCETDPPHPTEPYAISKWEAEQGLQELASRGALQVVRVRPPLILGPHVKGNLLRLLRLVEARLPVPLGAVRNQRSFVALDDLCELVALCVSAPQADGQLFLAANEVPISTPALLRAIADAMRRPVFLPAVPLWSLQAGAGLFGFAAELRRLTSSLVVDATHARQTLSWRPAADGIARSIQTMVASYLREKSLDNA